MMNLRHIIFILVYFLALIISISISSSIASEEQQILSTPPPSLFEEEVIIVPAVVIDAEKSESQIELPPLDTINDNAPAASDDDNEVKTSENDNDEAEASAAEQPKIMENKTDGDDRSGDKEEESKQSLEKEKTSESIDDIVKDGEVIEHDESSNKELSSSSSSDSESTQENLTIPVFSEWTQQQQEAEKKLVELSSNSTESNKEIKNETLAKHQIVKMRQKNYALPDCGAKILASNPEAQHSSSVLSDKDEYMLSPCTDRIWFVVELCDSIQAQRVELANFELFSSPLKSVSISLSNRFPTRDWTIAGHFDAKSERGVQNFDLKDVTLFGKFVRVDLQYTNTEHYCPLSFFRIFGTSEIEAFEVENEPENRRNHLDDDDDYMHGHNQNKIDNSKDNILNRAGAAVLSIVQKAAEALVKSNGSGAKENATISQLFADDSCMSLSHNIVCEICSNDERIRLHNLISCKNAALSNLLLEGEIKRHLINSITCNNVLGFNLQSDSIETSKNFIVSILPAKYLAAMCNIVAGDQSKLSLHVEKISDISANLISKKDEVSLKNISKKDDDDAECKNPPINNNVEATVPTTILPSESVNASDSNFVLIEESKNKSAEEQNIFNRIERQPFLENESEEVTSEIKIDPPPPPAIENEPTVVSISHNEETTTTTSPVKVKEETKEIPKIDSQNSKANSEIRHHQQNKINELTSSSSSSELKINQPIEIKPNNGEQKVMASTQNAPESVFLRLSNRIKVLEKNMTLSTQYLEELSRRYKKQIEDLQQSYAKLQIQFDSLNQGKRESEKRDIDEKKQIQEEVKELSTKAHYMEIIFIVLTAFLVLQLILIIVLFKRMSILRDVFVINEDRTLIEKGIEDKQIASNDFNSNHATSSKKRSKQRVRKISAPNILSRQNGHPHHHHHHHPSGKNSEFISSTSVLNRTASAPHKVNEFLEMKENLPIMEQSAMLEENDEILIPNFEGLRIKDDFGEREEEEMTEACGLKAKNGIEDDDDTASTASIKTTEDQNSNSSFSFARRLSSPSQFLKLKKTTPMKMKNGRVNHHHKKAKSESPPKINSSDSCSNFIQKSNSFQADKESRSHDESLKFRKNNSFKKLFKKLF